MGQAGLRVILEHIGRVILWVALGLGGALAAQETPRESITFILGEDDEPGVAMYRLAKAYFERDPQARTDHVVSDARSLEAVRQRLATGTRDGRPWGIINWVLHGSAQGVLDIPALPGDPVFDRALLESRLRDAAFKALPDNVLDSKSEIRIHGCALGRAAGLLKLLSEAFGGRDPQRPILRASHHFTCFEGALDRQGEVRRYLCESFDLILPGSERPPLPELEKRFRSLYPKADLDLARALSRRFPEGPGEVFSFEGPATYTWTLLFPAEDRMPCLGPAIRSWLLTQPEFLKGLHQSGFRFPQFHWMAIPTRKTVRGRGYPALQVIGSGRVIHVYRALAGRGQNWSDPKDYATVR